MATGNITWLKPVNPEPVVTSTEVTVSNLSGNTATIDWQIDLKGGATILPQISTISVGLGNIGDIYAIDISSGLATDPDTYLITQETGDTIAVLAERFARALAADARVETKLSGNNIVVVGKTPGQVISIAINTLETTTPANITIVATQSAIGTPAKRGIIKVVLTFDVTPSGNPSVSIIPTMLKGDIANTELSGASEIARIHPSTISAIRTTNQIS